MFSNKAYRSFLTMACTLRHNSVRTFKNFIPLNSTHVKSLPYSNVLLASAAAIGISVYIAHKNKIICDIDLNMENKVLNNVIRVDKKYDNAIQKSRDILQRVKDEGGIPGLVIGVSIDGKTVWEEGFGYADVENRVVCSPDTVMRIASISKSITMAAVAKLWEEGKLDLDKPVQEYVPSFPQKHFNGKPVVITCRQLVSHLSGIRHYSNGKNDTTKTDEKSNMKKENEKEEMEFKEYYLKIKYNDLKSALDLFKDDPLIQNPGTKYLYSTHAWTLVSAIVETVSKEQFTRHITKLFKTLGMNNTYLDENDVLIYNRSRNYLKNKRGFLINAPYVDNSYKWAGGGFLSTVGDLIQFANAMLYSLQFKPCTLHPTEDTSSNTTSKKENKGVNNISKADKIKNLYHEKQLPGFLNHKTIESMWKPVAPAPNYGMGWFVFPAKQECQFCADSKFYVHHTGGAIGASSVLLILPKVLSKNEHLSDESTAFPKGITVAVLSNMQSIPLSQTAFKIARLFENE